MANGRFVAYYRVSTEKQGRSGLGLEAQQAAVRGWLNGGSWNLVGEYVETESGAKDDTGRPELAKALTAARAHGATLVIAKLDRLARDAHFLLGLEKAGVDFLAVDMPTANRLTVGIMAMVAEEERRAISARTKAALAAAKARGVRLGNDGSNLTNQETGRRNGVAAVKSVADQRARDLASIIVQVQAEGVTSASAIARRLNQMGVPTPRGGAWQAVTVQRVMARVAA